MAVPCAALIRARRGLIKVPEVTAIFWLTKLLTTAMGESTSDYLVKHIDPVVAVGLGGIALVAALSLQLVGPSIHSVDLLDGRSMVAISGTMAADVLHIRFGVPYAVSTPALRRHPRGSVHPLVSLRGNALDPQHRHRPPRRLLLGHGHGHLRDGHRTR